MAHTEFSVTQKARGFVSKVNPTTIPVPMDPYLKEVQAVLRVETDMEPEEAGYSIALGGKRYICVNGNDREERQRFTICHEIAHIVLGLPSEHRRSPGGAPSAPSRNASATSSRRSCCCRKSSFSRSPRTPR